MTTETEQSWTAYPLSSPTYESALYDGKEIRRRLCNPPTACFSESSVHLRIFDVFESDNEGAICRENQYTSVGEVVEALSETAKPRVRIISIHSKRTIAPLQINPDLMQRVLSKYDVAPEFVPIILSFGYNPDLDESGNSNIYVQSGSDGSKKISYEIRYVEDNQRGCDNPWSLRHTGVYHHHTKDFDLWILLQSVQDSAAEDRLLDLVPPTPANRVELQRLCENPFRIHLLLTSSYFMNWRWELRRLARQFKEMNHSAMTFHIETPGGGQGLFDRVQSLRNIHDNVLSAKASCKGDLQVVNGLMAMREPGLDALHGLPFQAAQLQGFIDSADVLQGRVQNTIDLIGYTLDLLNQREAANVYRQLQDVTAQHKDLTQSAVDDSATVKIITFVSALYLPGSFVASLYGMNFFVFDTATNTIAIADDFWVFVITWIPLTLLTATVYIIFRNVSKPREKRGWPWKQFRRMNLECGALQEKQ